jgi:hypothetical protein
MELREMWFDERKVSRPSPFRKTDWRKMLRQISQSLWTSPTSVVGLAIGGCCFPFGARWQLHSGVIEISGGGVAWLLEHATLLEGGALAITFGEVVLARTPAVHDLTRTHERIHVRQARRWGPFFIPAYLGASAYLWCRGKDPYRDNPFEVEAYREAR